RVIRAWPRMTERIKRLAGCKGIARPAEQPTPAAILVLVLLQFSNQRGALRFIAREDSNHQRLSTLPKLKILQARLGAFKGMGRIMCGIVVGKSKRRPSG